MARYSNESNAVDIVAPGGYSTSDGAQILVASPVTKEGELPYRYSHGTSYATPQVAGTIAMMKAIKSGLTPNEILERLQNRATKTVASRYRKDNKKFKMLNAGNAVDLMKEN